MDPSQGKYSRGKYNWCATLNIVQIHLNWTIANILVLSHWWSIHAIVSVLIISTLSFQHLLQNPGFSSHVLFLLQSSIFELQLWIIHVSSVYQSSMLQFRWKIRNSENMQLFQIPYFLGLDEISLQHYQYEPQCYENTPQILKC